MTIDYSSQLERLARVFNDNTIPPKIIPTKPDDPQSVLSLPPQNLKDFHKQITPQQVVDERLATLEASLTKEKTQPRPPKGSATKEQTDSVQKQEQLQRVAIVEQQKHFEKVSQPTRGRGRPKGSKNKPKRGQSPIGAPSMCENEKLSQAPLKMEKLSHDTTTYLPVNINISSQSSVKGKTSLCYALLYARELTPVQVETLLSSQLELNLTSAEVIALSLIDRTIKHDVKAEKIYWDLLKNEQKNAKIVPEKTENTLLDDALAKAENAIFGEIVVDKPEDP